MNEIIEALPKSNPGVKDRNTFVRCVRVKEEHAQLCKDQLAILWADFFKPEHLDKFPDLHDKVWKAVKLASDNKQNADLNVAKGLMSAVFEIAEIFDQVRVQSKGDLQGSVSDNPDAPKKKLLGK